MKEIQLNLRKPAIANIALGLFVIFAGIWLGLSIQETLPTGMLLGGCVSLWGIALVILGSKYLGRSPHPIRYGNGIVELPIKAASKKLICLKSNEIIYYGVKSYMLPYIKVFEICSEENTASISLEAFENKSEMDSLLEYLASEKC